MRKTICLALVLLVCTEGYSQHLIPFAGTNGLYGYADPAGKILTPPQFKKAWLPNEQGLVVALDTDDMLRVIRRDGKVIDGRVSNKNNYYEPQIFPVTNYNPNTNKEDTLANTFCIRSSKNQEFLLVKNGKQGWYGSRYLPAEALKSRAQIFSISSPEYSSGRFMFYNGLHRVIKGPQQVNFINTDLQEIFESDQENGLILKNKAIALADSNGRYALADVNGKVITPFVFSNITPTLRDDHFIVNYNAFQSTNRAGMIKKDGTLVIDTAYYELKPATDALIVAAKEARYRGLIDYRGKTVLPFEYDHLEPQPEGYFIASGNTDPDFNIIDAKGKSMLAQNWQNIQLYRNFDAQSTFYCYQLKSEHPNPVVAVADSSFQLLFSDNFSLVAVKKYGFWAAKNGNKQAGVYSRTGKPVLPLIYNNITELGENLGFIVEKDSMYGLFSLEGQELLPCNYFRIVPEKTGDTYVVWCKAQKDKNLYTPFSPKGERLPISDQIAPTLRALEMKNCFAPEMENGKWKLTLPDGSVIYKPRDYPYSNNNIGTPDGCLMVEKANGMCTILNAYFQPIIPKGFFLPEKYYRGPYLKMGLIPVFNDYQCGIIDTHGEWVKKPGEFGYHILRPNMYSEHKGQPSEMGLEGITIYTITPEGTKSIAVQIMNDKFRDGYLVVGRQFKDAPEEVIEQNFYGGGLIKYALMDTLGQILTPFVFKRYPEPRGARWAAQIYAEDYSTKNVVVDHTGRIVFDFGDEPISGYDPERHWVYVTDKDGKTGIRDTLGNEILPMQYQQINWQIPGRIFSSLLPDGTRQLCDARGKQLLTNFKYTNRAAELKSGYCYVVTDDNCHIFSPENNIIASVPGKEAQLVEQYPDLFQVETEDRKIRYVNFKKSIVYSE
ncbi:MAG: WG repeat-containing protein [Lewinellaceae bacterium]|nr:WG repeat-containing protein [Lewinellaceae bacterium]